MLSDNATTLVVMAAGIGSRYGGLKQIEPVGPHGEILVDYAIHDAVLAGFRKIVFVIRREIETDLKAHIEPRWAAHADLLYAHQDLADMPEGFRVPACRVKPWGTGHAVYAARHAVNEPFGIINADDFYGRASFQLLADELRATPVDRKSYCMVAFVLRNTLSKYGTVARGICDVDKEGFLRHIRECKQIETVGDGARYPEGDGWKALTGNETVSMNMWGFTPEVFKCLGREFQRFLEKYGEDVSKELQLSSVIDIEIGSLGGTVKALESPERWLGVTNPEDKGIVKEGIDALIRAGEYPERLG